MIIQFKTNKLRKLCCEDKEATKKLGGDGAKRLRRRLDDLSDAGTLAEMHALAGKFHELTGNLAGQFSMTVTGGKRLVISPAGEVPRKPDGGIDLAAVTSIVVTSVEDYHD